MDPTTITALGLQEAQVIYLEWTRVAPPYQADMVTAEALIAISQPDTEPCDTGCLFWKPEQGPTGMYEARYYVPADSARRGPRTLHTPDFLAAVQFAAHGSRSAVVPPNADEIRTILGDLMAPGAPPLTGDEVVALCRRTGARESQP